MSNRGTGGSGGDRSASAPKRPATDGPGQGKEHSGMRDVFERARFKGNVIE